MEAENTFICFSKPYSFPWKLVMDQDTSWKTEGLWELRSTHVSMQGHLTGYKWQVLIRDDLSNTRVYETLHVFVLKEEEKNYCKTVKNKPKVASY